MNERKGKKRKCRRLPTWGSMRCKVSFPASCQLVYHSDCLFMITKMPAHFLSCQLLYLPSPYSPISISSTESKERERRMGRGGRKQEWERRTSSVHYNHIHLFTADQWNSVVLAVKVCSVWGELCIDCTESMNHLFSAILQGSGIHGGSPNLCSGNLCSW